MILAHLIRSQTSQDNERGNAMIYALLAIALFGILTATLSSQNNQADGQDIDDEMVELYANELIEYAAAAKNVVDQMIMTGSTIDDLDFVNPTSAAFDTPPHIHKVFHPQGGGLNYQETFNQTIHTAPNSAWFIQDLINVEWTPTAQNELILSALRVNQAVCSKINQNIGVVSSPVMLKGLNGYFQTNGSNVNIDTTECPDCEGYPTLCIESSGGVYGFYSILAAR